MAILDTREEAGRRLMADLLAEQGYGNPVGERLRTAREEKGLSLDDVARQTRIPIRHLEHIERGEWDALPAITYSVGFARSYANAVGLDGPAVGAELREQLGGARSNVAGPAAYYEPADPARVPPRSIAIVAAILAVLLVAGYLVWRHQAVGNAPDEAQIADRTTPADQAQAPPAQPRPAPAAQPQHPAVPAGAPVVLSATQDAWMRIADGASAKPLYMGTLKAGQQYQVPASAQAPTVRTGRAEAVTVSVGGKAVGPLGPPNKTISVSLKAADVAARAAGGAAPAPNGPAAAPAGAR
jgi:cytoskeletal protein RodZ